MRLNWKDMKTDGPPKPGKQCFIRVLNSVQLAYWRDDAKAWDNPVYGWLPYVYDDEARYHAEVTAWAYVPDGLFLDQVVLCSAYKPNLYGDDRDFCFGVKEIDTCTCKGNQKFCNFYPYNDD